MRLSGCLKYIISILLLSVFAGCSRIDGILYTMDDLDGSYIAVLDNSVGDSDFNKIFPDSKSIRFNSSSEFLLALTIGKCDARIEVFSMRYRLPYSDTYSIQLAVEEILNLIPLDDSVTLVLTESDKTLELEAVLKKGDHPYLSEEYIKDELSYSILQGLCDKIEETVNEMNETVIRLTIQQNTI